MKAAAIVCLLAAFGVAWGCASTGADASSGSESSDGGGSGDGGASSSADATSGGSDSSTVSSVDASTDAPSSAGMDAGALPDGATYRNSLRVCWNDATCTRALAISHGGDWNVAGPPYDSNAALAAAFKNGSDGVKIDVRVTKDDVPVISHSSPIETYESIDCSGKKIEEMTAAEVTSCHRVPSSETFQRLDDVLDSLRGQLVAQLCVKVNTDFGRTIQEVLTKTAQDFAFIEANSGDFPSIPALPGASQVYYVVNVGTTVADVDTVLAFKNPRIIMIEIDPSVQLNGMAASKLHPAGVRAFTYDNSSTATSATLKALFDQGYDVVSSNLTAPDVQARIQVNQMHGVSPP
jgi:hypothetical protein